MPGKAFIDTNIVIYALGPKSSKTTAASLLFVDVPVISTQVLSEAANTANRRFKMPLPDIRRLIITLAAICQVEIIFPATISAALDLVERYRFSWFDSLIIATALQAGCDTLYTEDLQHNQTINGQLKVINPLLPVTG
ncbi:MAG: PIN domain-containing protein [Phycisphaerae bacterium]